MINMIVAVDRNNAIGKGNDLPWRLRDDLMLFKKFTVGSVVIMGRKTAESLPAALSERINVVLTRDKNWKREGFITVTDAVTMIEDLRAFNATSCVIGGAEIYKLFLPLASKLMVTYVNAGIIGADTFMPDGFDDAADWQSKSLVTRFPASDRNQYGFETFIMEREVNYESASRSVRRSQNGQNIIG